MKQRRTKLAPANVIKIEDLFTREKACQGVDVPILMPDLSESGRTIRVRGTDSDQFKAAQSVFQRRLSEISTMPENQRETARKEADLKLLVSLVAGWTLDTEFNEENVYLLLREAPVIRELVDDTATRRSLFFGSR